MNSDSSKVRFSVIATVRNECAGISDFIESLLAQTKTPDEIVIVDAVSTDGTLEILKKYESQDKIRLISQPCNISEGRNLGINAARNEYIAATDAGCTAAPDWLEKLAAGFDREPQPDVVAGNYEFETHNDFELASCFATDSPDREISDSAKYYPSSRSIAFRKSAWKAVKGYPEWLYAAEDTLYNIQLRRKGFRFHFAQDAKVRWRPRTTWKGLYKQYFNYARGNGRIGLGLSGYYNAMLNHGLALSLVVLGLIWPICLLLAAGVMGRYIGNNFWHQAKHAQVATKRNSMLWLTLLIMEVVRIAGMRGFVEGRLDRRRDPTRFVHAQKDWMGAESVEPTPPFPHWTSIAMSFSLPLAVGTTLYLWGAESALPALGVTLLLAAKSVVNFSRTGPQLRDEIQSNFLTYSVLAFGRLALWSFLLCVLMTGYGQIVVAGLQAAGITLSESIAWIASFAAILLISTYQFCVHLLYIPASLAASSNYRLSRFHRLWAALTPNRLKVFQAILVSTFVLSGSAVVGTTLAASDWHQSLLFLFYMANSAVLLLASTWNRESAPPRALRQETSERPLNLVMIGCDTLRADRLGIEGYFRSLTPNIDGLVARGQYLSKCFVPCARTAPSLSSMLTGLFPQNHGIRDNFSLPSEAHFSSRPLAHVLDDAGYHTVAISDWAGADLGKFDFGFRKRHLPDDQWNIKYLIRQGPKDIRLFLSLFTHNRFGKRYLPELHYLAGVPMSAELGRTTRETIREAATRREPFFINTFFSSTHAPFGSEYPFYTLYSEPRYAGDSKFVMANVDDPFEIIKRQRDRAQDVDLDQILSLYDGGVRQFDDEVGRIMDCLRDCGLQDNTIVLIYSDHGIDFFEHESWGQGNSVVSDQSARVPIVIADPRRPEARTVSTTTRTVDIYPTVLDLMNIPIPSNIDGVSLAKGDQPIEDLPVYGETGIWFTRVPSMPFGHIHYPDLPELLEVSDKTVGTLAIKPQFRDLMISAKDRMILQGRWKLVRFPMENGLQYSLYDTEAQQPGRGHDVATDHPEVINDMLQRYEAWFGDTRVVPSAR